MFDGLPVERGWNLEHGVLKFHREIGIRAEFWRVMFQLIEMQMADLSGLGGVCVQKVRDRSTH